MSKEFPKSRLIIRFSFAFLIMSLVLFLTAGKIMWFEAWIYLILQFSLSIYLAIWLKKNDPELLKERMKLIKSSPVKGDKILVVFIQICFLPLFGIPGLDAVRFKWSVVPLQLKMAAFIVIFLAFLIVVSVMKTNSFLSKAIEIDNERHHRIINTGPYYYVRHPLYLSIVIWISCFPMALGSYWGFIPALAIILLIIIRTISEDNFLARELPGYKAYKKEVKYKLFPGVW